MDTKKKTKPENVLPFNGLWGCFGAPPTQKQHKNLKKP
jgi:hypothetical protein